MGNSVTADCKLQELDAITEGGIPATGGGTRRGMGCNVKAWKFSGKYRVACSEVDLTNTGIDLDQYSTYLILVLKHSGETLPDGVVNEVTGAMGHVFTPRGVKFPFTELRAGPVTKTVYAMYGKQSSSLAKAKVLKKALELEKRLSNDTEMGETLFSIGHPVPIPSPLFSSTVKTGPPALSSPIVHMLHSMQLGAISNSHQHQHHHDLEATTDNLNTSTTRSNSSTSSVVSSAEDEPAKENESWSAPPPMKGFALPQKLTMKPVMPSMALPTREKEEEEESPPMVRRGPPVEDTAPDEKQLHDAREQKMRDASKKCSEILPHLFVSGQHPAENLDILLTTGLTDIINTAEMIIPCKYKEYFNYYAIRMRDSPSENIFNYFPHCVAAIERSRKKPDGKMLVHCHQGVSRSCTLIACYLMWRYLLTPEEAMEKVKEGRDVARPNAGFAFRLMEWKNHLMKPGEVIVYRLAPFGDESVLPPVLALEKFNDGIPMDSRTAYVILQWREKKIWIWKGARCPTVYHDVAVSLAPEVALYGMRTSPDCSSQLRWPPGVVESPILVEQGSETDDLLKCLTTAGCHGSPNTQSCYDIYEDKSMAMKWHEWLEQRNTVCLAPTYEQERSQCRSESHSSTRYLMEQLNIKDMYTLKDSGDGFILNDSYHENGLDEDDYFTFQETAEASIAVFIKLRGELRVLDVWMGEIAVDEDVDPEERANEVISLFKKWSETGTMWGGNMEWSTVKTSWVLDGCDEDSDLKFSSRWVSS